MFDEEIVSLQKGKSTSKKILKGAGIAVTLVFVFVSTLLLVTVPARLLSRSGALAGYSPKLGLTSRAAAPIGTRLDQAESVRDQYVRTGSGPTIRTESRNKATNSTRTDKLPRQDGLSGPRPYSDRLLFLISPRLSPGKHEAERRRTRILPSDSTRIASWMGWPRGGVRIGRITSGDTPSVIPVHSSLVMAGLYVDSIDRILLRDGSTAWEREAFLVHEQVHRLQRLRGITLGRWWSQSRIGLPQEGEYARTNGWEHQAEAASLAWMWRKACREGRTTGKDWLLQAEDQVPGVVAWAYLWEANPAAGNDPIEFQCVLPPQYPTTHALAGAVWALPVTARPPAVIWHRWVLLGLSLPVEGGSMWRTLFGWVER